jgi:hypothetical protein
MKALLPPDSPQHAQITTARLSLAQRLASRGKKYPHQAELLQAIAKMLGTHDPLTIGLYLGIDWTMEGCPDEDPNLVSQAIGGTPQ